MLSTRLRSDGLPYRDEHPRHHVVDAIARVLDLAFGAIYLVLGVRLLLEALQARRDAGFFQLLMTLSRPFYEPFKDIVGTSVVDGHPIVWSIVVAMVAFAILHSVLRALLGFLAARG